MAGTSTSLLIKLTDDPCAVPLCCDKLFDWLIKEWHWIAWCLSSVGQVLTEIRLVQLMHCQHCERGPCSEPEMSSMLQLAVHKWPGSMPPWPRMRVTHAQIDGPPAACMRCTEACMDLTHSTKALQSRTNFQYWGTVKIHIKSYHVKVTCPKASPTGCVQMARRHTPGGNPGGIIHLSSLHIQVRKHHETKPMKRQSIRSCFPEYVHTFVGRAHPGGPGS